MYIIVTWRALTQNNKNTYKKERIMNRRRSFSIPLFLISIILTLFLSAINYSSALAQWHGPIPLHSAFQLDSMSYNYNPSTQTLTKSYTFTNISGQTLTNPRLVNLFLWSNNICGVNWSSMSYDGTNTFSNLDQAAIVANNDGTMVWSTDVSPSSISSTQIFSSLPVQSVQAGTSYPYWNIPGHLTEWLDGESATIQVTFSNVQNCNWVQNMVYPIYDQGPPTLIELSSFKAFSGNAKVTLFWSTESEIDNEGFNIYRTVEGSSEKVKINPTLIPPQGSATSGAKYTYVDSNVKNHTTYLYWLEDVDVNGVSTEHGPVQATPRRIYSLFQ
jgi:hypothetical protein